MGLCRQGVIALLRPIYTNQSLILAARDLDPDRPIEGTSLSTPFEFTDLRDADVHSTIEQLGVPFSKEPHFRRRLVEGAKAVVVRTAGGVACYVSWWGARAEPDGATRYTPTIPVGDAYIFDSFCHPGYRRRGLNETTNRYIMERARLRGTKRVWMAYLEDNYPAARGATRSGILPVTRIRHRRVFGISRTLEESLGPLKEPVEPPV